jgi:cytoskeletal protein RodZ
MSRKMQEEEPKPRPWEQGLEEDGDSFGGWLRQQREIREMTLREISDVTKISLRYLEALEQNRFEALPAQVFAKGFLREYARYVGLDPDEVVNYFMVARQELEPEGASTRRLPSRLHSSTHWAYGLVLTGVVVALFGVVALVSFWAERRGADEAEPPPIAAPVFAPPAASPVAAGSGNQAPLQVTLDFTQTCWVEALIDERERISELRVQGESLRLKASESVSLTLGNAAGVRIEVNGQPLEIAGDAETVRDLEITLDSLMGAEDALGAGGPSL